MWSIWRKFKLMPWQYGMTEEPVWEHIKAIQTLDFMMQDAERMEKEAASTTDGNH